MFSLGPIRRPISCPFLSPFLSLIRSLIFHLVLDVIRHLAVYLVLFSSELLSFGIDSGERDSDLKHYLPLIKLSALEICLHCLAMVSRADR